MQGWSAYVRPHDQVSPSAGGKILFEAELNRRNLCTGNYQRSLNAKKNVG
jgi:hypothetical protein